MRPTQWHALWRREPWGSNGSRCRSRFRRCTSPSSATRYSSRPSADLALRLGCTRSRRCGWETNACASAASLSSGSVVHTQPSDANRVGARHVPARITLVVDARAWSRERAAVKSRHAAAARSSSMVILCSLSPHPFHTLLSHASRRVSALSLCYIAAMMDLRGVVCPASPRASIRPGPSLL